MWGKNASLSGGSKLNDLKLKRNKQLGLGDPQEEWPHEEMDEPGPAPSKKKKLMETAISIDVDGTPVTILCPAKRAQSSDLLVKLDAKMLEAVFQYVQDDRESQISSRSYVRTGKYKQG